MCEEEKKLHSVKGIFDAISLSIYNREEKATEDRLDEIESILKILSSTQSAESFVLNEQATEGWDDGQETEGWDDGQETEGWKGNLLEELSDGKSFSDTVASLQSKYAGLAEESRGQLNRISLLKNNAKDPASLSMMQSYLKGKRGNVGIISNIEASRKVFEMVGEDDAVFRSLCAYLSLISASHTFIDNFDARIYSGVRRIGNFERDLANSGKWDLLTREISLLFDAWEKKDTVGGNPDIDLPLTDSERSFLESEYGVDVGNGKEEKGTPEYEVDLDSLKETLKNSTFNTDKDTYIFRNIVHYEKDNPERQAKILKVMFEELVKDGCIMPTEKSFGQLVYLFTGVYYGIVKGEDSRRLVWKGSENKAARLVKEFAYELDDDGNEKSIRPHRKTLATWFETEGKFEKKIVIENAKSFYNNVLIIIANRTSLELKGNK